jgi:hypothetical protein
LAIEKRANFHKKYKIWWDKWTKANLIIL